MCSYRWRPGIGGTHDGLAVYEKESGAHIPKDGLAHNGIVSIDVSELTGDVWIGTLGGLSRGRQGNLKPYPIQQWHAK